MRRVEGSLCVRTKRSCMSTVAHAWSSCPGKTNAVSRGACCSRFRTWSVSGYFPAGRRNKTASHLVVEVSLVGEEGEAPGQQNERDHAGAPKVGLLRVAGAGQYLIINERSGQGGWVVVDNAP